MVGIRFQGQTPVTTERTPINMSTEDISTFNVRCSSALPMSRTIPLFRAFVEALKFGVNADYAEFGVYRGETAASLIGLLLHVAAPLRMFHLFDTFTGLPDPHQADLALTPNAKEWEYYEHYNASMRVVRKTLWEFEEEKHYILYPGLIEDSGKDFNTPLAFAHVDCDLYEGTRDSLEVCKRNIVPYGVVVVDDYNTHWTGVTQAVDEFMSENPVFKPIYPEDPEVEPSQYIMVLRPREE